VEIDLIFRDLDESDLAFVYNSWLINFRDSNNLENLIDKKIYFDNQTALIKKILSKSEVVLASSPEDESQIFGFIVFERFKSLNVLHYVYVKSMYRRLGIGRRLKDYAFEDSEEIELPILSTHMTRMSRILTHSWNLIFNPYYLLDI
jgi:hypothetical protein